MISEGWLFEAGANPYIGMRVRRFFVGFGKSDGVLVAYLAPERNDGKFIDSNRIDTLTPSCSFPISTILLRIYQLHCRPN